METGFILIKTAPAMERDVFDAISKIPEISETYALYGEYDLISKITAPDTPGLTNVIVDKLRVIPGIKDTKTLIGVEF